MSTKKVWQGRFSKKTSSEMEKFSHSISLDCRLFKEDLKVNKVWTEALEKLGIIDAQGKREIDAALAKIAKEFEDGEFSFQPQDEDIHTAIERRLTELTDHGAKIHTGRSRNDQIMTDLLLYLKEKTVDLIFKIRKLEEIVINFAEENLDVTMPGYTHLQPAQPILFSHYLLSLFWLLERDKGRLLAAQKKCRISPLGSGALAGSGFGVDRNIVAQALGFEKPSSNSIDITAHRDIPTEIAFIGTLVCTHLSRYAADLIIWASREFGFVTIDQGYTTGSSIMPQKVNPDSLELIRGKATTALGHLTGLISLCHGLPHAYSRDLQEDKRHVFAIIEIAEGSLDVFNGVLESLTLNKAEMAAAMVPGLLATELADYLVLKGISFRRAHEISGRIVRWTKKKGISLKEIPLKKLKEFATQFDADVYQFLNFKSALNRRNLYGGTGLESVKKQLQEAKRLIEKYDA